MIFGERLKTARIQAGLTQLALAEKTGIQKATVSSLELGVSKNPAAANLLPLARALNVDPEWLITGKGNPRPSANDETRETGGEYNATSQQERMMLDLFRNLSDEDRRRALRDVQDAVELRQLRAKKQANGK